LTMPDTMSMERRNLLRTFGAELVLTPGAKGMRGAVEEAEAIVARTPGAFMPQQFENPANPEIHRRTTAREILDQTGGRIDAFVAGVGTGGTITGVGEVLKQELGNVKVYAVEPAASPILSGGQPGPHRIQGIGANFIPKVLNRDILDGVITVADDDAWATMARLSKELGLLVGTSSGAAAWAAFQVAAKMDESQRVVTVMPDTGERDSSMTVGARASEIEARPPGPFAGACTGSVGHQAASRKQAAAGHRQTTASRGRRKAARLSCLSRAKFSHFAVREG